MHQLDSVGDFKKKKDKGEIMNGNGCRCLREWVGASDQDTQFACMKLTKNTRKILYLTTTTKKKIGDALSEEKGRRHGKRSCEGA